MISLRAQNSGFAASIVAAFLVSSSAYAGGVPGLPEVDTAGLFNPATEGFALSNTNAGGPAAISLSFGPSDSLPVAGDYNGNGTDTIGVYSPSRGTFYLNNLNVSGVASLVFRHGPRPSTLVPLVGDWDGDGEDTVGFYNAVAGRFFLRNTNALQGGGDVGDADLITSFGPKNSTLIPLVGKWTGGAADGIGLYDAVSGRFILKNDATTDDDGSSLSVRYGSRNSTSIPVVGDWNDDGVDTIGLYDPATSRYSLRNSNTTGAADEGFRYGSAPSTATPIVGNWDGTVTTPLP